MYWPHSLAILISQAEPLRILTRHWRIAYSPRRGIIKIPRQLLIFEALTCQSRILKVFPWRCRWVGSCCFCNMLSVRNYFRYELWLLTEGTLGWTTVLYHAKRLRVSKASLLVHIIPLLFSSLCYLAVFLFLSKVPDGTAPSHTAEISKLVLWFLPIIVEIISHFVALSLPGFVKYSTESVYARSGTVFLIM